ncbi:putative membrane protein [Rivularia sp. PCC 7116]|uniref:TMEM165/GDT1 family protein n=1 Tax=Rivularia sp. PCC 7116 TaxID=373994 RepID=UPI00029EEE8E|nr:TMEM165/GDT1 family protein [Rivularia sp. PCC 7116]AFY53858.1 putative membrane protein [Rivularia sp. PCC 7116]
MLTAFISGFLLITVSEIGDKTFFIAMILAMQHSRRLVFAGAISALAAMTMLSVGVGQAASLLPEIYIHYAEIALFIIFGFKLLYDSTQMPSETCDVAVVGEAKEVVEKAEKQIKDQKNVWAILLEAFVLVFVAEWGDRTQIATIALAAENNPIGVSIGAILGHAICAVIAVTSGRMLAGQITERQLTAAGGCLFIVFGVVAAIQGS